MNWTRRDFIKASGIAAGAMVLDLTLPLPTMSSGESTLPEEETIHTAFIGLGAYGREVGRLLSKNWKSDNPISLHCLRRSAFESNPLIQQKGATQRIFQGYGSRVDPSFSKFWKKDLGLIHQLDRDIDPDTLQEILRGKELILLACDEFDEAWKMARYAALEVEPFLLISLQPTLASKTHPHALLSNESILQTPPLEAFPSHWDPVSCVFGSLVNPGLIGVDLADLKEVIGGKHSHVRPFALDGLFKAWPEKPFNIFDRRQAHSAFMVIEHDLPEIGVYEVVELAKRLDGLFLERYYAVPLEPRRDGMVITVCCA